MKLKVYVLDFLSHEGIFDKEEGRFSHPNKIINFLKSISNNGIIYLLVYCSQQLENILSARMLIEEKTTDMEQRLGGLVEKVNTQRGSELEN